MSGQTHKADTRILVKDIKGSKKINSQTKTAALKTVLPLVKIK
ncbi:hypothetical protein MDMS009_231 [Methylophaga thiooxydans DMS010]|uniref:Uncharacterized protein n=1 Tax=Methylophaga thiooxydans DMS010 TaxID=637616 RepID=C0N213_9GAMM|nr:hypothetical protein MDMS009_231 [Methylophaga thiooxydans DMS010]